MDIYMRVTRLEQDVEKLVDMIKGLTEIHENVLKMLGAQCPKKETDNACCKKSRHSCR
jgi:hypothetical protein